MSSNKNKKIIIVAGPTAVGKTAVAIQIAKHFNTEEEVTAVTFEQYALQKAESIFKDHEVVVMVGGTGLYIKAFCEGLDSIPDIDVSWL